MFFCSSFSEILIGRNSNTIVSRIKNFHTSKGTDYNFSFNKIINPVWKWYGSNEFYK